jgi:transcriptional regulator with XRE-family HTH domain
MARKRPPVPEARGSSGNPTVRRRELGVLLRALRNARELTVDQVAAELLCSPSKVSRMETGQRGATARDIRDLCDLYEVNDPAERERLTTLAREGKQQGWWQTYALPYTTFVGLEQEATSMRIYAPAVIPGLFQTGDYTRGVHNLGIPQLEVDEIEIRVEERAARQRILTRENPPQLEVMLDEATLHRPVGGPAAMREQLDRILEAMKLPNVAIQVVPYKVGAHPALDSNFVILAFESQAPAVVYVEGLVGYLYLERPPEIERYLRTFEILRNIALSPQDSAALLARVRDTYTKR